jgi:hypothetical protein
VKGRESDIAEGLRYPFSLLPPLDRSEGLKDRKERNLTQVMRDCRETLDRMSSEGLGGGLTPKASVSRRKAFEENVKSLAGVRKEVRIMMGLCEKHYYPNFLPPQISDINSKGLEAYKRGSHRSAVLSRLRKLRQREEDLLKVIGKEKRSSEYEEKHFSFAFLEAEVGNIANTLAKGA